METLDEQQLLNADKRLFAVDLVDYIIIKTRPSFGDKTANILARVDNLRNFTYNRFNKTIKKALNIIDVNQDSSVFSEFEEMLNENTISIESFIAYANFYRKCNLPDGFHAKSFLMYCDRVANMAGYFLSVGVDEAPEVAVELIMEAFPPHVMYHASWNKFTKAATTLEVLGNDYYEDGNSSNSSSEQDYVTSSDNEGSSASSVNMDVSVSSPDDISERNLDIASSILAKTSRNMNASNGSSRTNERPIFLPHIESVKTMDCQSSENTNSSVLSSFKNSSNDASLASPEKGNLASSVLAKTSGNINASNGSSRKIERPIFLSHIESVKTMDCQSSENTNSSVLSSFKNSSNDASPASPEKADVVSSVLAKTSENMNVSNGSSRTDAKLVLQPRIESVKAMDCQSSDSTSSSVLSSFKYSSNDASPANPEEIDM